MRFIVAKFRFATLALLGVLAWVGAGRAGVVYSNDFESNTTGFDKTNTATLAIVGNPTNPTSTSTFLGVFGNDTATLSLSGLTAGTVYSVQFDLYIGATWDGSYGVNNGPDVFTLKADGTSLVDASFARANTTVGGTEPLRQSYSDATPVNVGTTSSPYPAQFVGRTGADVNYSHPTNINLYYSIYYFGHGAGNPVLTFTATGTTASLTFAGTGLQPITDEFWAVDNVTVASVPEPSSIAMSMIGLAAAAAIARRRARG